MAPLPSPYLAHASLDPLQMQSFEAGTRNTAIEMPPRSQAPAQSPPNEEDHPPRPYEIVRKKRMTGRATIPALTDSRRDMCYK